MATIPVLTPEECEELFTPVLGAYVATLVKPNSAIPDIQARAHEHGTELRDSELPTIGRALAFNSVFALGAACFGYAFERYARRTNKEVAGKAFGLHELYSEDVFKKHFPSNTVRKWEPDGYKNPYWFSSMIRNAFAHGQWEIESGAQLKVMLKNIDIYRNLTFDVTVTLEDLRRVLLGAIYNFILKVQQDPAAWQPRANPNPRAHETLFNLIDDEITGLGLKILFHDDE